MAINYPQLDGVRIGGAPIPWVVIQAFRKAYDYIAELQNTVAVLEAAGVIPPLLLNSGAAPSASQLTLKAGGFGALSLLCFSPGNSHIYFDAERLAGSLIARDTSAADIQKGGSLLTFRRASGLTVGAAFAFTNVGAINLTNGRWGFGGNIAPGYSVDTTGDTNTSGVYRIGGTLALGPAASVNLAAQVANIATTNLRPTGVMAPVGLYLIQIYFRVTTAGAAGTLTLTIGWNDGIATTFPISMVTNAITTPPILQTFPIYTSGAADITYAVSGITAGCQYLLKIKLTQQF